MNLHSQDASGRDRGEGRKKGRTQPRYAAAPDQGPGDHEISFGLLARKALENKRTILSVAFLFIVLAWLHAYNSTPLYTATARLVLQEQDKNVFNFESVVPELASSDYQSMNTELLVLTSRTLLREVVETMALHEDPEFNPDLLPTPAWKESTGYSAAVGFISDLKASLTGTAEDAPAEGADPREVAVATLGDKLNVRVVPQTYAIEVTVTTQAPQKSAGIANTLADRYIARQLETKFSETDDAMVWLSERVADLKGELEAAEKAVREYAAESTVISEETLLLQTEKLKRLRDELGTMRQGAEEGNTRIAQLEALRADGDYEAIGEYTLDPQLGAVSRALAGGRDDASLSARFDSLFEQRIRELKMDVTRANRKVASLEQGVKELEEELQVRSIDFVRLQQLQREAEATRLIYEHSLARMKEISIQQGIQRADARVLDPAKVPDFPSHPRTLMLLAAGGFFGTVCGFFLVFMRSALRTTLQSSEELEAATGLPVMGVIPETRARRPDELLQQIFENPASPMAEAIRNLRTTIQLSNLDAPPQLLMLTSTVPGEGKSTVCAALAQANATAGKRVLLIDADLRRRAVKSYFRIDKKDGLLAILSGKTSFDEAVHHEEASQMDVIIADEGKVTAGDVFGSHRFESFLAQVRQIYDIIIIDTPPILAVSDTRAIARNADAIIYVVKWNSTEQRALRAGLNTLWQVNADVSGIVLNRVKATRADSYGYYGYNYT